MRYIFLLPIIAYGGFTTYLSRISPTNSYNASAVVNCLVFYIFLVLIYLSINRMKDWKFLLIYSLIVIGYVT